MVSERWKGLNFVKATCVVHEDEVKSVVNASRFLDYLGESMILYNLDEAFVEIYLTASFLD